MTIDHQTKQTALDELLLIYDDRATARYGLTHINQLAHAVQSGKHARAQGLTSSVVVAALLHDIGHMVHELGDHPAALGVDDKHEEIGSEWLKRYFGPDVTEPIRLHVAAKRYLCTVESDYFAKLSPDSIESLNLQGGLMAPSEIADFEQQFFWKEAIALRRIDDIAKDPHGSNPKFTDFLPEIYASLNL